MLSRSGRVEAEHPGQKENLAGYGWRSCDPPDFEAARLAGFVPHPRSGLALPLDPNAPDYAAHEAMAKEHHRGLHSHDCAAARDWLARNRKDR